MLDGKPRSIRSLNLQVSLCSQYHLQVTSLKDIDVSYFDFLLTTHKNKLASLTLRPMNDNPFIQGFFKESDLKRLLQPSIARGISVLHLFHSKQSLDVRNITALLPDLHTLGILMDHENTDLGRYTRHKIDYERFAMPELIERQLDYWFIFSEVATKEEM